MIHPERRKENLKKIEEMEKLKPCPFCGGKAEIYKKTDKFVSDRFYPACTVRHCIGRNRSIYFPTNEKATAEWNKRTD